MSTKYLKQFSHRIGLNEINHGGFTVVEFEANALVHPAELMSVVSQGEVLKLHFLCDKNQGKNKYKVAIAGTGCTIPSEYADSLYKIGQLLLGDEGQWGYAVYFIGEMRGVAPNASDAGLTPVFSVKVKVDADGNNDDLIAYLEDYCSDHSGVIRLHQEDLSEGDIELFCYNNEFRHTPEFTTLMSHLYTTQEVFGVYVDKRI